MKKIAFLGAAFALIATPACAQSAQRLMEADRNDDNVVTRQEMLAYRPTQFDELDRNNDGFLTDTDRPRFMRRAPAAGLDPQAMLASFDRSGDGRVSRAEFVSGPTILFDRADLNNDDVMTRAEVDQAAARAREARP